MAYVFVLQKTQAQNFPNYSFQYYGAKSGLKGTEIYSIEQDNFGLIWLGTNNGIYQFDGYNYIAFENNSNVQKTPPKGAYRDILKHSDGNLWIATDYSGVSQYNSQTNVFTHYKPNTKTIADGASYLMREDENKNIWFAHYFNGISIYNYQTKKFDYLTHQKENKNSLLSNEIYSLCSNKNGGMWIAFKNAGLSYYNIQRKEFTHYTAENNSGINTNNVYAITIDNLGTVWIGTEKGILYKRKNDVKFSIFNHALLQENYFFNGYFNAINNLVYFTSSNGLHIINPLTLNLQVYKLYPNDKASENTNRCTNLLFDKNNTLWIQFNQGFCIGTEAKPKLTYYNDLAGIGSSNRLCFFEVIKNETIYSISKNYLLEKNIDNKGSTNKYIIPELNKFKLNIGDIVIYNPGKYSSYLIINVNSKALYLFNTKTKQFEKIPQLPNGNTITEKKIYDVYADSRGNIWGIDKHYGIIRFNYNEKKWIIINPNNEKTNTDFYYYPTKFIEDKFGNVWGINPFYGILKFTYQNGNFILKQFKHEINNPFSPSSQMFYTLTDDSMGNIVFAGNGKEIDYYLSMENKFFHLKREACFDDITANIIFDKLGYLWCFNIQNIYKIKCNTQKFTAAFIDDFEYHSYNWKNGFEGNYFGNNFVYLTKDYNFYFDSKESLLNMKPNTWENENKTSETKILNLLINGKPLDFNEFSKGNLALNYNQNNIEFQFASNSLLNAQNNIFKYKLEPYDIEWRYTTVFSPKTVYNNLSPNTYKFIIYSANSNGYWSKTPTEVNFKISPLFYTTIWFKLLCVILFLLIVYLVYLSRINTIKKQEKIKTEYNKKIAELESKALRSQMNPHFVFNSLNSIQNYIVKNDIESSNKYLSKFAKLTRLIFDHSQQQFITLQQELNALKTYVELEQFRFKDKFDFNIKIDEILNDNLIEIPPLIIQPFVENAIWHGIMHKEHGHGVISIELSQIEDHVHIVITDNGIGRVKSAEIKQLSTSNHQSSGMRLTKERLDILNANNKLEITCKIVDLYDKNKVAIGTQVQINIPIN